MRLEKKSTTPDNGFSSPNLPSHQFSKKKNLIIKYNVLCIYRI